MVNAVRDNPGVTVLWVALVLIGLGIAVFIKLVVPIMVALLVLVAVVSRVVVRIWTGRSGRPRSFGIVASSTVIAIFAVFVAIQALPYGREHSNPPITGEPQWANPETRALMVRACFDCHSNEATWPWYSNVAPFSWAVTKHVSDGRNNVNYSEFDRPQDEEEKSLDEVKSGSMPPGYYTAFGLHADAKLSDDELATLMAGLAATPGLSE